MGQAYEPDDCGQANPELKQLLNGEGLEQMYFDGCGPGWTDALSTSFLKSSGKPPQKPIIPEPEGELDDAWEDYRYQYDLWTCKYAAYNLSDGDTRTAWVEGVDGHGVCEFVMVPSIDLSRPIYIWNGYGKSENLYNYNSRVKAANIHVIKGGYAGATQCGTYYVDIEKVARFQVQLKDMNDYQLLDVQQLTEFGEGGSMREEGMNYWLGLEILEVYPGTKWSDTCISEIKNIP